MLNGFEKGALGFVADMHIHSNNSHDSECPINEMCAEMIKKGIPVFALTDHFDAEKRFDENEYERIRNSVRDAKKASEEFFGKVTVLKGVELGEGFWDRDMVDKVVNMCDYDVIIGSVHQLRIKGFDIPYSQIDFSKNTDEEIDIFLNTYFDDCLKMFDEPYFDIFAHLTCPLRYITGKYKKVIDLEKYADKTEKILKAVIDNDIALEINTSNLGTGYDEFMPSEELVKKYIKMGGEKFSVGSDAHIAENAAKGLYKALKMLKENGISRCYYFKDRKAVRYAI